MEVGFIGLGAMGRNMVRRLLQAGHKVTVFNRTRKRSEELAAEGAKIAETPAAASKPGIVMTMVADDAALDEVAFGSTGILKNAERHLIHISLSTVSPTIADRLADAHHRMDQAFLSVPVFGRPEVVAAGNAALVAAGHELAIGHVRPLLQTFAQKIAVISGHPRDANIVKLSGNFLIASMIESLGEAFALIRKSGIDPKVYFDVMSETLLSLPFVPTYAKIVADESYDTVAFRLRLALKDIRLALEAGERAEVPMPVGNVLRDRVLSGLAKGYEDLDWSAIARVATEDAGLETRTAVRA